MPPYTLQTDRLLISEFRDSSEAKENLYALTSNSAVMAFFPALLSREESDALLRRIISDYKNYGHCYNAVYTSENQFAGIAGIIRQTLAGEQVNELAYRFMPDFQGQGLATEACRAIREDAIKRFGYGKLCCFVRPENKRARELALRVGFIYDRTELFKELWHDIFILEREAPGKADC